MTMLAVAPPWTTASTSNLRRTTSVLPITIVPPSSPPLRPLPKQPVNAPRQQTASPEISIASDAPPCPMSRGFPPWRFADAGPRNPWRRHHGPASENLHSMRHQLRWASHLICRTVTSRLDCGPWCGSGQSGSNAGCRRYWPLTSLAIRGLCIATKRLRMPN